MTKQRSMKRRPDRVTISPKFQIVIPQHIREELKLEPGRELYAVAIDGQIVFVPLRPLEEYLGILQGPNDFEREKQDRF
ncbi:MAG TPA: AbrB/MazE/SpoVT family DNA-binding domain-containing protein [Candidatus Eisenbacteria bacterium]